MANSNKKVFSAIDFSLDTTMANVSEITLTARYPETGQVVNLKSEMLVYILRGEVKLTQNKINKRLSKGSMVLIKTKEPYYCVPAKSVTLLIFSTPAWTIEQQKIIL